MNTAQPWLIFPGQTSARPGMWEWPLRAIPARAHSLLDTASRLLGRDLLRHYHPNHKAQLATNRDVQIGVFLANHLHMMLLEEAGVLVSRSLGLSLGEYNHLVHIGALSFEDALVLIEARGRVYDEGPVGAMAAVFPLSYEELSPIVERARAQGAVDIALVNSPTQHVIAGEQAAVESALAILEDEHFLQGRLLEAKIPMHASSFAPAAEAFRRHLERIRWRTPHAPYHPNVEAKASEHPRPSDFIELLTRHVCQPVLWQQSIEFVLATAPGAFFIEVGPGSVLTDLGRRWQPAFELQSGSAEVWARTLETLKRGGLYAA